MSDKAFCETCRKMVDYTVRTEESEANINHEKIVYDATITRCVFCHNEVFVSENELKNLDKIIRGYFTKGENDDEN